MIRQSKTKGIPMRFLIFSLFIFLSQPVFSKAKCKNMEVCWKKGTNLIQKKARKKGLPYIERSCSLGKRKACLMAMELHENFKNKKKKFKYKILACYTGDKNSCSQLAQYYTKLKKYSKANKYHQLACKAGAGQNCQILGSQLIQKASALFEKGCQHNDTGSCHELGAYWETKTDFSKAETSFKKACIGKNLNSCLRLGQFLERKRGLDYAHFYFEKACELGDKGSCSKMDNYKNSSKK